MHGSNVEMCIKNVSLHSELNLKIIRIEQNKLDAELQFDYESKEVELKCIGLL